MKRITTTIALLLGVTAITASAQNAITGKVVATNNQPLIGATVLLIHLPDSAQTAGTMADANGSYSFNKIKAGSYLVKATMLSFYTQSSAAFNYTGNPVLLPTITLKERTSVLKAVNITSMTPQIEQKSDRLVVNVEKLNTAGDNALEVLKKAPGIRLDKDDNILYRNNGGVTIMIDGKRSYMSGAELSNYLKSLPGNVVSKIELIANPPANYDAEGTAGIINIIMKRNKLQGFNGNANTSTGYGRYGKASGGTNLNYNTGNLSAYVRGSLWYSNSYNELKLGRQIGNELYNQVNYWHPKSKGFNYTAGADYFLSTRHTLGLLFRGYNAPQTAEVTSNSVTLNNNGGTLGSVNMAKPQTTNQNTYSFNINYAFNIDTLGQKLSIDGDYITSQSLNNEGFTNRYFDAAGNQQGDAILLRNTNPAAYQIKSVKADYVYPFAKSWRAEAGWKSSWVGTDNDARFDSLKTAGWVSDPKRTNHFKYTENINAFYATLNRTFGKLELKAGIRAEQTRSNANSLTVLQVVTRNYWNVFPSFFASYKLDADNQLNASYSPRISRPGYSSLNPFTFYTDPYTAIQGNPYLQPSFSRSALLSYTHKSFQVLSLSYIKASNVVNNVVYQNDQTKQSTAIYQNLGTTASYNATSAGSFNIVKWWNMSAELDASYNIINTDVKGSAYHAERFAWSASTEQTFMLPKNIKIQLSGMYYSPSVSGLSRVLSGSQIDVGITKTFLDKRASISLKMRDVFFGNRYRSILQYNNINTTWQNEWESRRVTLGITYQFGNLKIKTARSRSTGATSEEGRM